MPSILSAMSPASLADLAIFTPPPLPRPPAWICALTTTPVAPALKNSFAAESASSREVAIVPRGTVTPYFLRIPFPWYSWIFIIARQLRIARNLLAAIDCGQQTLDFIEGGRIRA